MANMSFHVTHSSVSSIILIAGLAALLYFIAKYLSSTRCEKSTENKFIQDLTATARALPSSWYRSKEIYELERRAIFARKWIFVSHKLRFSEVGSCVEFKEAGFQFSLVKNKDGVIEGFRDTGKQHASSIANGDDEKPSVIPCDQPECSYGLLETLPENDDIQDSHAKVPVHVLVDDKGFIWVNLDTSNTPEDWSTEFKNIDKMVRHESFNFEDYQFDHTWGMSGDYNWKTLADNYNECYHCKTAHPDAAAVSDLTAYRVNPKGGNIEHFANTTAEAEKSGLKIVSNYYFPNACMTVS
jgi:phenylpropionate dioxygenase-like ring-hydroxylating dioxygenase large terminal subunit